MPTCPNGHQSGSDDWCEVCGHRMAGAGAPAGSVPPPPPPPPAPGYGYPQDPGATAQAQLCPQCRTPREGNALFCEECRWNFLTNTATSYTPLAPQHQAPGGGPGGPPPPGLNLPPGFQAQQSPPRSPESYDYQGSRPSQVNRPAEPLSPDQQGRPGGPGPLGGPGSARSPRTAPRPPGTAAPAVPAAGPAVTALVPAVGSPAPPQQTGGDDWVLPPPSQAQASAPPGHFQQGPPPQQHQQQHDPMRQQPPHQYQPPGNWTAVVAPDRDYFMAMMQRSGPEATGLNLPAYSPEQHLPMTGSQITIGRRRHSTGESPDVDLSVPPEDPGVSHQHAVLIQQPDGSWAVIDQNSTNGTTLNGAEDPIQPYVPVPLKDGDRVHVGAWTTITIRRS